jgi:hypothetical protein
MNQLKSILLRAMSMAMWSKKTNKLTNYYVLTITY